MRKSAYIILFTVILSLSVAGQIEFNDSNDIQFRTGLEMNSNAISGLPSPSSPSDAVPKSYADSLSGGGGTQGLSDVLEVESTANQTIYMDTNQIVGLPDATADSEPITLGQIGEDVVNRSGDSMNGNLDMNGNKILNAGYINAEGDINLTGSSDPVLNYKAYENPGYGGFMRYDSRYGGDLSDNRLVLGTADSGTEYIILSADRDGDWIELERPLHDSIQIRRPSAGDPVLDYKLQEGDDYGAFIRYDSNFSGDTGDNRLVIGTEHSGNDYLAISAERNDGLMFAHRPLDMQTFPVQFKDNQIKIGDNIVNQGQPSVGIGDEIRVEHGDSIAIGSNVSINDNVSFAGSAVAIGHNAQTSANDAVAIGKDVYAGNKDTIALGEGAKALQNEGVAISAATSDGEYSFALGYDSATSADRAVALGFNSSASGSEAYALGEYANAASSDAYAIGDEAYASGNDAYALGANSSAISNGAIAIGLDSVSDVQDTARFGSSSRPYDVDITGDLNVDGSLTGVSAGGSSGLPEVLAINNTANQTIEFDSSNGIRIGDGSTSTGSSDAVAVGKSTTASAIAATAVGDGASASNDGSTSIGIGTGSTGRYSTALGNGATAGFHAAGVGSGSVASGGASIAVGKDSTADGNTATAVGTSATSSGRFSTAIGPNSEASSDYSAAVGDGATASSDSATAIGVDSSAKAIGGVAIGKLANAPNSYEATLGNLQGEELDLNVTGNATVHGASGIRLQSGLDGGKAPINGVSTLWLNGNEGDTGDIVDPEDTTVNIGGSLNPHSLNVTDQLFIGGYITRSGSKAVDINDDLNVTGDLQVDGELTGVSTGGGTKGLPEVLAINNTANQSINLGNNDLNDVGNVELRQPEAGDPVMSYRMQEGNNYGGYLEYDSQFSGDTSDNRVVLGTEDSGTAYEVISADRAGNTVYSHRDLDMNQNKIVNLAPETESLEWNLDSNDGSKDWGKLQFNDANGNWVYWTSNRGEGDAFKVHSETNNDLINVKDNGEVKILSGDLNLTENSIREVDEVVVPNGNNAQGSLRWDLDTASGDDWGKIQFNDASGDEVYWTSNRAKQDAFKIYSGALNDYIFNVKDDGSVRVPNGGLNITQDAIIQGNIAVGSNTNSGLASGDINASNIYYNTLTAKSPVVQCSQGTDWCKVSEPSKQSSYFVKVDESFDKDRPRETALEVVETDVDTMKNFKELKQENKEHEQKIQQLNSRVQALESIVCEENPEEEVCN